MIARETIIALVNEKLESNMFLVDVDVKPSNVIHVEMDCLDGLSIDHCVEMSRYIESHLNRDAEDFELQVSSPGIDQYFKVNRQFHKNLGRDLEVITCKDAVLRGKLVEAGNDAITLEVLTSEKPERSSRKQTVKNLVSIDYLDIKKAKVIISFK